MDVDVIKQGAIFFIDDLNSDESVVYKGETTPKKRRPWVVVSNDKNNCYSQNITMCPLYTRNTTSLPTQVYIQRGTRDSVICCEQVTAIPKHMIDTRAYVGMLTPDTMLKVKNALKIYFDCADSNETIDIRAIITSVLTSPGIENVIASKLVEMMMVGLTTNTNIIDTNTINTESNLNNGYTNNSFNANAPTTDSSTKNDFDTTKSTINAEPNINVDSNTESVPKTKTSSTPKMIKRDKCNISRKSDRKIRGTTMSLQDCILFMKDVDSMTEYDLVEKWKSFGFIHDNSFVSKKKYSIRKRLKKEGLL